MEGVQMGYAPASAEFDAVLREQLLERRDKLQEARPRIGFDPDLTRLLNEVDAALARFETGTFGLCEACHDPIESERLISDPLIKLCLGDLTQKELDRIQDDLQLAAEIQKGLLPKRDDLSCEFWSVDLAYQPAGVVSGDYVDVIRQNGELYFILGDVSGKGMAASILMSNLHAMFRALIPLNLPLCDLVQRANSLFCESTLANQYATLICGKLNGKGELEFCNAGHLPPIIVGESGTVQLESTGLPLGMFCDSSFISSGAKLNPGETLLLFSDGVTEANDEAGDEFGVSRLIESINGSLGGEPTDLLQNCVSSVSGFRGNAVRNDDLTMMALKYTGSGN
ncbi:MAG TPA: SpoIIE family protein phosphatase [Pyrinomonadaceae bacterium]|nr:SpoIIE family protein phosphatase [Pyrinomonadaceae bacterium]